MGADEGCVGGRYIVRVSSSATVMISRSESQGEGGADTRNDDVLDRPTGWHARLAGRQAGRPRRPELRLRG